MAKRRTSYYRKIRHYMERRRRMQQKEIREMTEEKIRQSEIEEESILDISETQPVIPVIEVSS